MQSERELTAKEIDRLDFVHNNIHELICTLAGEGHEVPWDMSVIGEISDIIEDYVCETLHIMTATQFAPYVESGGGSTNGIR